MEKLYVWLDFDWQAEEAARVAMRQEDMGQKIVADDLGIFRYDARSIYDVDYCLWQYESELLHPWEAESSLRTCSWPYRHSDYKKNIISPVLGREFHK